MIFSSFQRQAQQAGAARCWTSQPGNESTGAATCAETRKLSGRLTAQASS